MDHLRFILSQVHRDEPGNIPPITADRLMSVRDKARRRILPHYINYISIVSSPVMSLSLETCVLLEVLCEWTRPARIWDLGSGFSSFVFRSWAKSAACACRVITIDDDSAWLEKTREFLISRKVPADDVYLWGDFDFSKECPADLILHDLGNMDTRRETLPWVLAAAGEETILVLDDMHKPPYREAVIDALSQCRCSCVPLRDETEDSFGRYTCVAYRFTGGPRRQEGRGLGTGLLPQFGPRLS
jgi:hypothetical protein